MISSFTIYSFHKFVSLVNTCIHVHLKICILFLFFNISFQFISLSAGILQFLNTYFVSSSDEVLQTFIRDSLSEEHMNSLALLIKDMDRECAKLGNGKGT